MSREEEYRSGFEDGIEEAREADERPIDITGITYLFEIPEHLIEALTESEAYQEGKEAGVKYYYDHK